MLYVKQNKNSFESRARAAKSRAIRRELGAWWRSANFLVSRLRRSISRSRLRRACLCSNVSQLASYAREQKDNRCEKERVLSFISFAPAHVFSFLRATPTHAIF